MSADTASGPNHSLFVQVLAQIEREPRTWDQGMWATRRECGTSYCFAGHACVLTGHEFRFFEGIPYGDERETSSILRNGRDVVSLAVELLGLPAFKPLPDIELFHEENTLDDLYRISADILGLDEQVLREKVAAEVACGSVQP
jgi:hypothetical protein